MGVKEKSIKTRGKDNRVSQARSLIAYWGNKELGISGSELARYFGITKQSISEAIQRGEKWAKENNHYLTS